MKKKKKNNTISKNIIKIIKDNKKISVAFVIVLILMITLEISLHIIRNNTKDLVENTSNKSVTAKGIVQDEEYQGLKFTNSSLIKDGENYTLTMNVKNTTNKPINIESVSVPIKDKDGNELISLLGYIGDEIKPNETRTVTASTDMDLSKAIDKEITEYKKN